MRYILCLLAFALSLTAATETASVTVPDAQATQLAAIIESWIDGQVKPDGTLKYAGDTMRDRRQALLDAILRDGVRRVVRQACNQFPADCPSAIKTGRATEATGKASGKAALDELIQ